MGNNFPNAGPTCPVSCIYYNGVIHVEHFLDHAKMPKMTRGKWANDTHRMSSVVIRDYDPEARDHTNGANKNKVFHRCYHRAVGTSTDALALLDGSEGLAGKTNDTVTRECSCECAQWTVSVWDATKADSCSPSPQCGTSAETHTAHPQTIQCKFHSKLLDDTQCYTADRAAAEAQTQQVICDTPPACAAEFSLSVTLPDVSDVNATKAALITAVFEGAGCATAGCTVRIEEVRRRLFEAATSYRVVIAFEKNAGQDVAAVAAVVTQTRQNVAKPTFLEEVAEDWSTTQAG
jgi:hypothetical protein